MKALQLSVSNGYESQYNGWDGSHFHTARIAAGKAYKEAGIERPREQISMMEVHDCFSVTELVTMEDLFISPEGKGWRDVLDGFYDADGGVPCQIDGGLKCFGHPIGASGLRMLYEMYLQLQGRAGERQLANPVFGMTHNLGGAPASNVCSVAINWPGRGLKPPKPWCNPKRMSGSFKGFQALDLRGGGAVPGADPRGRLHLALRHPQQRARSQDPVPDLQAAARAGLWQARGLGPAAGARRNADSRRSVGGRVLRPSHHLRRWARLEWRHRPAQGGRGSCRGWCCPNYAGPFERVGRLFAPRYRQASLYTYLTLRDDARDARRFAYGDVLQAFRAYVSRYGQDRPFVIVGVEQGGSLAARLLREEIAGKPELKRRLVAAYLIETVVPADEYGPRGAAAGLRTSGSNPLRRGLGLGAGGRFPRRPGAYRTVSGLGRRRSAGESRASPAPLLQSAARRCDA